MALENGKWRVVKGDCLWNIAKSVYKNPYKWKDIANANGISQSRPIIYPNQLLTLPGITSSGGSSGGSGGSGGSGSTGGSGSSTPAPTPPTAKTVTYRWFALDSGTERDMFATWSFSRTNFDHYEVKWEYDTGAGGWRIGSVDENCTDTQSSYTAPENAKKVKLSVKPISATYEVKQGEETVTKYYWTDGQWSSKEYNFANNPPSLPPSPSIEIDIENILTVTIENIEEDINADSIEIAIYQNDTIKYKTAKVTINKDARFVKYTCKVDPGAYYKVRCRAVRGSIYGGWTDFTSNDQSLPVPPSKITTLKPQIISEQMSEQYAVFVEWEEVKTAKIYELQWTTNIEYFDNSSNVSTQSTEEGKGPRLLVTDIELGHEYFFRVRSMNDKGPSQSWSAIKSVVLGSKPSAPTTWSNATSAIVGEDLNLYWTHNSTDGSIETYARINIVVIDSLHPTNAPKEYTKVIQKTNSDIEEEQTISVYTINTTDTEWSTVQAGFIIKWKVQTAGVASEYSEWSVEREVNVYAKPELELDILNQNDESINEINSFPFYISVLAKPPAQIPISYYVEIIANKGYETVDDVGNKIIINPGDKVYQKYYDPDTNAWRFALELSPANIDLQNDIEYTVNCTVSMNSGLTATVSQNFNVYFNDIFYDTFADIAINKETLEATIHPYCYEYNIPDGGEATPELVADCTLSVYRREYDGSFTEIATGINNAENTYVTDPHPSLDYARYRIVAKTNDTGAISYSDVPAVKVGEPSIIIQWAEKWTNFETGDNGEGMIEPPWSGSMIKIPYNVDFSENNNIDMSLIEYAGRKHPVSYYGTQLGSSSTGSVEIPATDKETLYGIRRLSRWMGDVYFREPSGVGYWANVAVSYNMKHKEVTIPITFTIKRVEGGM